MSRTPEEKREFARKLRANPSPPEKLLWERLRKHALGVQFHRQVVVRGFIPDFVCYSKRLIIEVDGQQHEDSTEYDAWRDDILTREAGYKIVRFWARDVFDDLDGVVAYIAEMVGYRAPPPPAPPAKVAEQRIACLERDVRWFQDKVSVLQEQIELLRAVIQAKEYLLKFTVCRPGQLIDTAMTRLANAERAVAAHERRTLFAGATT